MSQHPLVLFDLDGTLVDSVTGIAEACNRALALHGFAPHHTDDYRRMVGNGADMLILRALPPESRTDAVRMRVRASYDALYIECCKQGGGALYPGVAALLARLRGAGLRCGVLSNKPHDQTDAVCTALLSGLLDGWQGQLPGAPLKPDPAGLHALEQRLGGRCIAYAGDSEVDVQTALAAGFPPLAVGWGLRDRETLAAAGAKKILMNTDELGDLLIDILHNAG